MTINPRFYGIWQPGQGWLKAYKKGGAIDAYATDDIKIARDLARRVGGGARVEYIDDAIVMLEEKLKEAEKRVKWWEFWKWNFKLM